MSSLEVGRSILLRHKIPSHQRVVQSNSMDSSDFVLQSAENNNNNKSVARLGNKHKDSSIQLEDSFEEIVSSSILANEHNKHRNQGYTRPVMGKLYKVWSRLKKSSSSSTNGLQKAEIKRQNSEDASHFCYIPGDQFERQAEKASTILEDSYFRNSASHPLTQVEQVSSSSSKHLQEHQTTNETGSSGISTASSSFNGQLQSYSSSSSSPQGHSKNRCERSKLKRSTAEDVDDSMNIMSAHIQEGGWMNRIRRSASSFGQQGSFSSYVAARNKADLRHVQYPIRSNESSFESERSNKATDFNTKVQDTTGERDGSEASDSGAEIYSTPHESIQSVQSGLRIVKSLSTNNFYPNGTRLDYQIGQTIDEHVGELQHVTEATNSIQDRLGNSKITRSFVPGSKFFISSSSSEESSATTQQSEIANVTKVPMTNDIFTPKERSCSNASKNPSRLQQYGFHSHSISPPTPIMRPNSLMVPIGSESHVMLPIVSNGTQLFSPSAVGSETTIFIPDGHDAGLCPAVAAMSPLEPQLALRSAFAKPQLKSFSQVNYKKSPSLYEFSESQIKDLNSPQTKLEALNESFAKPQSTHISNSISLYDCQKFQRISDTKLLRLNKKSDSETDSEYKLAQMMLEAGFKVNARDQHGFTALMYACLSGNISAIKCLIEHGADVNQTNLSGFGALDLICNKQATEDRLEIVKILIDNKAELDRCHTFDGSRLLDRLIEQHNDSNGSREFNKLHYIECLLQNGAKLGSSTWMAASGKGDIQVRLLQKLCQDGYYLYKKSSIEAAVYRFDYALKRLVELEQHYLSTINPLGYQMDLQLACKQLKYQAYLGLSRCERKRKFLKRALEFAHSAILVDSFAYEAYYSKAHILKDIGDFNNALATIDQSSRLVDRSIEQSKNELKQLEAREESIILGACFNMREPKANARYIDSSIAELASTIEYLEEARNYIGKLRLDIQADLLKRPEENE